MIAPSAGMGEGLHIYKVAGKYILTSAWFLDEMRMPVARADRLEGPWEINQDVSRGEDFGLGAGYRVTSRSAPFRIVPPDSSRLGRCALHQGGIVETPTGEWWGFSMMDANSVGRLTALSPVTWKNGWPYFGLEGNLGRTPRTWVKPNTGSKHSPQAPYRRSDDFSGKRLQPVWQWNHVPVDGKWSLSERRGFLRLHALPAPDLWRARNTLTQRSIGPRSTVTATLETSGMKIGDVAGLALFNRPYAWLGIERSSKGHVVAYFDESTGEPVRTVVLAKRVWLRAECDFVRNKAAFRYSTDGKRYVSIGQPYTMAYGLITFQGVRYSLFSYNTLPGNDGGHADFDAVEVDEEAKRAIPYGKRIELSVHDGSAKLQFGERGIFTVVDRGLGRVALRTSDGFVSVDRNREVSVRTGAPTQSETFQWMETFDGEVILMSLLSKRYLRISPTDGKIVADSPGPRPDGRDGVRFLWRLQ
jgi:hypothetical protein